LTVRRAIFKAAFELRVEIAEACTAMAETTAASAAR
jgi:hypothetical protein